MALLNENRSRIPQVAVLPVTGDDGGIRGQMRMLDTAETGVVSLCAIGDEDIFPEASLALAVGSITYVAVATGTTGEAVTITHATGGVAVPVVTVVGTAITVTGDATTTAAQIVTAITDSPEASALVSAVNVGGTTLTAVGPTSLTGGTGTYATVTVNTDLVVTAAVSGSAGNDLTIEIVDAVVASPKVMVTGNTIVVTGNSVTHTTADLALAITNHYMAGGLITAAGSTTSVATVAETALTGGASLAVWMTFTAS